MRVPMPAPGCGHPGSDCLARFQIRGHLVRDARLPRRPRPLYTTAFEMGVFSSTNLARAFCGLSLLLLSAAQQKAFALPVAAPPAADDSHDGIAGKKKKAPLTLRQTLPDAFASRGSEISGPHAASRSDRRFPPLDCGNTRLVLAQTFNWVPAASVIVRLDRWQLIAVPPDPASLHAFRICLSRIGPPIARAV
jgi:hypothetical protein